jgi:cation-transporting ATPase E
MSHDSAAATGHAHDRVLAAAPPDLDLARGLTNSQVADRISRGQLNTTPRLPTRTFWQIFRANALNILNILLFSMAVVMVAFGRPVDALFGFLVLINAAVGSIQELRAKRTLERLVLLDRQPVTVLRDGETVSIDGDAVVLDDLMVLAAGQQIIADGVVVRANGVLVDESLLTGESDPVAKAVGDQVMSGSYVVVGSGVFRAAAVGADSYAAQLTDQARQFAITKSELMTVVLRFVRFLSYALVPLAAVLLWRRYDETSEVKDAVTETISALVGLIPEGLVLFIAVALAVGVVRLGRSKILVRELAAVEGLARVDVICFDKTGTLTDGTISFDSLDLVDESLDVSAALGAFAHADESPNNTLRAIATAFAPPGHDWAVSASVPFSSEQKWSSFSFGAHGHWVLGAPEMVLPESNEFDDARAAVDLHARRGLRVVVFAQVSEAPVAGGVLAGVRVAAVVVLVDTLRPDAADTVAWLARQGIALRVISGDSPVTVGALAQRAGIGADESEVFDARNLPEDAEALADILQSHSIFGRVKPEQKRAMVKAMQSRGMTVAMVGDGVNDVLALKDSDMGIAMGNGADATRAVAQVVLLDSKFAALPKLTAEGRRVLANVERTTYLWGTKVVAAFSIALAVALFNIEYPLLPRHLTLVNGFAVSVPAFFLALQPNETPFRAGFGGRAARFALPAGLLIGLVTFSVYAYVTRHMGYNDGAERLQAQTAIVMVLISSYLATVLRIARPLNTWKAALVATMFAAYAAIFSWGWLREDVLLLELPQGSLLAWTAVVCVSMFAILSTGALWRVTKLIAGHDDPTSTS